MGMMKRVLWLWMLLISTAMASDVQARWDRAVQWMEDGRAWVPGHVQTEVKEMNSSGEHLSKETIEVATTANGQGGLKSTVTHASKDGVDTSEARGEKLNKVRTYEEHLAKQRENDLKANPFARAAQADMVVTDLGQQKVFQGRLCVKVGFLRKVKRKEIFKGWAWLDAETHQPVWAHIELVDRPWMVKSLVSDVEYGEVGQGIWGAKTLKMKGSGGMLGMTRYFQTVMKMKQYWQPKP